MVAGSRAGLLGRAVEDSGDMRAGRAWSSMDHQWYSPRALVYSMVKW